MTNTTSGVLRRLLPEPNSLGSTAVLLVICTAWIASFALMAQPHVLLNALGVLVCAHSMVLAAYLVHEAAHQNLFAGAAANRWAGETASFIAGGAYASFERIRHMHVRHHVERADLTCFDLKRLLASRPLLRRLLQILEWAYIPAVEIFMRLQVITRPLLIPSQRKHLVRAASMLLIRASLFALLAWGSLKAALLYAFAVFVQLHVLNLFDAFHHTFEQHCVAPDVPLALEGRDRVYEQANTYSNLIATRHAWINLLVLNFGYHNAHHHRPSVPWWRLPSVHRKLHAGATPAVLPVVDLLRSWHRNRVRRVFSQHYGVPGTGSHRGDTFIGTHGVSFLTVV